MPLQEKYDLPPGTESWTLRSIAKKWRNWKSELKKKYYDPELPMQVLLQERDKRAFVEQYVKLVAQWNSEKSKVYNILYVQKNVHVDFCLVYQVEFNVSGEK